jgi:hypothetical protein
MPSQLHEVLLQLFRNRPLLAPELLRDALQVELPNFTEARIDSADLTEVQPAEYRADLVVLLLEGLPVLGIVVEVQLSQDDRKRFVWPVYVATLRARLKCHVCLLAVTVDEAVARWAAKPIDMGNGSRFVPLVLRPSGIPEVTDEDQAQSDPELAVLSAMAHGRMRIPKSPSRSRWLLNLPLRASTRIDSSCILILSATLSARPPDGRYRPWIYASTNIRATSPGTTWPKVRPEVALQSSPDCSPHALVHLRRKLRRVLRAHRSLNWIR